MKKLVLAAVTISMLLIAVFSGCYNIGENIVDTEKINIIDINVDPNGTCHILWNGTFNGNNGTFYRLVDTQGNLLSEDMELKENSTFVHFNLYHTPDGKNLLFDNQTTKGFLDAENNIHIFWRNESQFQGYSLFYVKINPQNEIERGPVKIFDNSSLFYFSITSDKENNIYLAWTNYSYSTSFDPYRHAVYRHHLYYMKMNDSWIDPTSALVLLRTNESGDIIKLTQVYVGTDSNDNVDIAYLLQPEEDKSIFQIKCLKVDANGTILRDKEIMSFQGYSPSSFFMKSDTENNISFLWTQNVLLEENGIIVTGIYEIHYMKLNENLEIIHNNTILSTTLQYPNRFDVGADANDNVYIVWVSEHKGGLFNDQRYYEMYFTKVNSKGELLQNHSLSKITRR